MAHGLAPLEMPTNRRNELARWAGPGGTWHRVRTARCSGARARNEAAIAGVGSRICASTMASISVRSEVPPPSSWRREPTNRRMRSGVKWWWLTICQPRIWTRFTAADGRRAARACR